MKRPLPAGKFLRVLFSVLAGVFALMFLMPTLLTITNSFMSATEIAANYGKVLESLSATDGKTYIGSTVTLKFIPDMVSFSQYVNVLFRSPEYLLKFWNSVLYVVPIVVFQLVFASLAAFSFMRSRTRFKHALFFIYIVLMLMPYQVILVPNYIMLNAMGLLDSLWAIILPGVFAPLSVFLLTKYMRRIPSAMIEAAMLDGASEWKIFIKVCIPICTGALYSVAMLLFIDYWNMVEQPLILLSDAEMHPLSVFLSKINAGDASLAFAVATIYLIAPLLMFLHGEDYLVDGITYSGGLKD